MSDKVAITFMLARYVLFPLGSLGRRLGVPIPDPGRLVRFYRCRSGDLVIRCPGGGGPYFLFCDPAHDPGVRAAIEALEGETFIDVGAHVGFFALLAAKRSGGSLRVLAFEPQPVRYQLLLENVAANGLKNVGCFPYAI